MAEIKRVAVLGAGTMGHGIAHAALAGGFNTRLYDVSGEMLGKARTSIEGIVAKSVELGKLASGEAGALLGRLQTFTSLPDAVREIDLIIEAAPERIDLKLALFAEIERHAPSGAV